LVGIFELPVEAGRSFGDFALIQQEDRKGIYESCGCENGVAGPVECDFAKGIYNPFALEPNGAF
jgi:hypothetical protein